MNKRTKDNQQPLIIDRATARGDTSAAATYVPAGSLPWVRRAARGMIVVLLSQATLFAIPVHAQVTSSPSAPAGQRPIMDAAQNGVPIVHIAPPSAAGVSRNQYDQFNVNPNGLILNNSASPVQTQQGGWISGNMQLGHTPARIILNEVMGANASQLRGTIEVAGRRADIVIANPNGITCNGCGFLNTGRASLTTGQVQFGAGGAINGFDVRQGELTIGGNGLNASNVEQLDLIARGIVIEGEVWASNLNVIAGANQVLYGTLQAAAQGGAGTAPRFAIDIKDVGGMYAHQIYMIATEQGLGVNSTGRMAALQGNLVLNANGDLTLRDSYAKQEVQITTAGNARLTGQTQSEGATSLTAGGTLVNQGAIDTQGRLDLNAASIGNSGTVTQRNADGATLTAAGELTNTGTLFSGGKLTLNADRISDTNGSMSSAGDIHLAARAIALDGTGVATDGAAVATASQTLSARNSRVRATGDITFAAGGLLDHTGTVTQSGRNVSATGNTIQNTGGTLLAAGQLNVSATDTLDNTRGKLLAVGNAVHNARTLNNKQGEVVSDAAARLNVGDSLTNDGGIVSGKSSLTISAANAAVKNDRGSLISGGALAFSAKSTSNAQGAIDAARQLDMVTTGLLDNTGGAIASGTGNPTSAGDGGMSIQSDSLINNGGRMVARDALALNTKALFNDRVATTQGVIASTAAGVTLSAHDTSNVGGLITAAARTALSTHSLDNTTGEVSSGTVLSIDTAGQALANQGGKLLAGDSMSIVAGTFTSDAHVAAGVTQAAKIASADTMRIQATSLSNNGSSIAAGDGATFALGSGQLTNNGGRIEVIKALAVTAGAVSNQAGKMLANTTINVAAASADSTDGEISAAGSVTIASTGAVTNTRGKITSNGNVSIGASTLQNASGIVSAAQTATLQLGSGLLENGLGQLIGTQAMTVQSGEIRNAGGTIATGSALTLDTQGNALDNAAGQIVANGDLTIASGRLNNTGGTAASITGKLAIATGTQELVNNSGKLQALGNVTLTTGALHSQAGLISGQDINATTGALDNDRGQIAAAGNLTLSTQALRNNLGLLQSAGNTAINTNGQAFINTNSGNTGGIVSGGTLGLTAGSADNQSGFIASTGNQTLAIAGTLDNRSGQIVSNANSTITASELVNEGGRINALGNLTVGATTLNNRAGAIAANGRVTLNVATLDNRTQNNVAGAIDATNINVTATSIDNRGGALRAANDMTMVTAALDNTGGTLSAGNALTLTSTSLTNASGRIVGSQDVTVSSSSQVLGGTIASANNVTLNIAGDYDNTSLLSAQNNLTINSANLTNSGTLKAGQTLTANTGNLTNSGEISAHTLRLNASGTLTNTATGLIDGVDTFIAAGTLNNTGRIYGDRLKISGGTLNNSGAGVIAARDTLLLGMQNINNTGGGLLYSLGDIGMAGSVDAAGTLQGSAQSILNASSRIEAAGTLSITAAAILNRNDGLTTREVTDASVSEQHVQPSGSATKYQLARCSGIGGSQDSNGCIVYPDKYGQRSTVTPVYTKTCAYNDADWTYSCTSQVNYSWDAPVFAQFQVPPVDAPPVEPTGGCSTSDWTTGIVTPVAGAACDQWRADFTVWNTAFQDALTQLDPKVNAYNAEVNEDNRIDQFEDYTWFKLTSTATRTELATTAPAQILSGAGMNLTGTVTNRDSQIVAGGALSIAGPAVSNIATQGETRTEYNGTTEFTEVVSCGSLGNKHCRRWYGANPYNPAPISVMTDLATLRYESGVANPTAARNLTVATSSLDSGAAGAAVTAAGSVRSLIGKTIGATIAAGTAAGTAAGVPPTVSRVAAIGTGARANDVILTILPALTVPGSNLFVIRTAPSARYLVETDARFTNRRTFLSSDYFFQSLNRDPERQLKRYGDGFMEQKLVNDQILALTGRRYLAGYSNTETEYQALMDAGVAFAEMYQLTPGVALSAEQMARLTTDIVWLTAQSVTLPDGSTQQVLVPQVYLRRPGSGDLQPNGALIAGTDVQIRTLGDLTNSGGIDGDQVTVIAGRDLVNQGGRISGQDILLRANNDLKNLSGVIQGTGVNSNVTLLAGRDIVLQTQTRGTVNNDGSSTRASVQRIATVQGGNVRLDAARDITALGANVTAEQNLIATAARDITVAAVAGQYQLHVKDKSGRTTTEKTEKLASQLDPVMVKDDKAVRTRSAYVSESATTNQLANFSAGNHLALVAGNNILVQGADLAAGTDPSQGAGNALLQGRNVTIEAAIDRVAVDLQTVGKNSYQRNAQDNERAVSGSIAAAGNLTVRATGLQDGQAQAGDGNISIRGGNLSAQNGQVLLNANNDISITQATTRHSLVEDSYGESNGFWSQTATTKARSVNATQSAASIVTGNSVHVQAGRDLAVKGSAVVADNAVTLNAANRVSIVAATDSQTEKVFKKVQEDGFLSSDGTIGFSYGTRITTSDRNTQGTTQSQARSMVGSNNGTLTIVAGDALKVSGSDLGAGQDIHLLGKSVTIDEGRDEQQTKLVTKMEQDALKLAVGGNVVQAIQTMDMLKKSARNSGNSRVKAMAAAAAALAAANLAKDIAANGATVSLSLTAGHSERQETRTHATSDAIGSTVAAGRDLNIVATGAGKDSNINVIGSDLSAGQNATLIADNQVNLVSAQDFEEQHSKSKSWSAEAGIAATASSSNGTSFGFTASISASKAQEDGTGATQSNSHVSAGNTLTLQSGGDTNLKGAVASGKQVIADIGGDLNIESLQDTATFDYKSQSASVSATVGFGVSVSASFSKSKIKSDYASVQEQSGILAGDGGFDINVKGNTDLKGAVIASTQQAMDANLNKLTTGTLTTSDIRNKADYKGSSVSVSASASVAGGDGKSSPEGGKPAGAGSNANPGQGKGPGGTNLTNVSTKTGAKVNTPVAMMDKGSKDSITRSGISAADIVITDEAGQLSRTGKTRDETIAAINRDVATGKDTSGAIANDFDKDKVLAGFAVTTSFVQQAAPLAANVVGDIGKKNQDAAQYEADIYSDLAKNSGDPQKAAEYQAKANEAQTTADAWSDNGIYRVALHTATQAAIGGAAGGGAGALNSGAGVIGGNLGQRLGEKLGEAEAAKQGLTGQAKEKLVNSYQQAFATVGGALAGLAAGSASGNGGTGALVSAIQGGGTGYAVDAYNRQLHPEETKWIRDNAKRYAALKGISVTDAERDLAQQAYRQVQNGAAGTWDGDANAFLKQAHGMLPADGNSGPGYLFQATADQKANTGMYSNYLPQTADFYQKNGLALPTAQQVADGTKRDNNARDTVGTLTKLAPVAAAATVLAGLSPTLLTWVLGHPAEATSIGLITVETAAAIKSGAITPALIVEAGAVKAGQVTGKLGANTAAVIGERAAVYSNPSQLVQSRVDDFLSQIPANSLGRITMGVAVVEDANGVRSVLVSTSESRGYLRPGVSLQTGEKVIPGTGHAEADIVTYASANGLKIIDIGATRPVCPGCQNVIVPTGANITTSLKPLPKGK